MHKNKHRIAGTTIIDITLHCMLTSIILISLFFPRSSKHNASSYIHVLMYSTDEKHAMSSLPGLCDHDMKQIFAANYASNVSMKGQETPRDVICLLNYFSFSFSFSFRCVLLAILLGA